MQKSSVVFQICDDVLLEPQNLGKTKTKKTTPPKLNKKAAVRNHECLGIEMAFQCFFR